MFERRLKVLLLLLVVATAALVGRAFSIQVISGSRWANESSKAQRDQTVVDAPRGRLLDAKGREIAIDRPVIDVRVDYRAIAFDLDPVWVKRLARGRLIRRDDQFAQRPLAERVKSLSAESEQVRLDIAAMWHTLAQVAHESDDDMRQQRQAIVDRVSAIKRIVREKKLAEIATRVKVEEPWYVRWFGGKSSEVGEVILAEESQSHVILPDIAYADYTELAKREGQYPGLDLSPSLRRTYPFGPVAAQALGRTGAVDYVDIRNDPSAADDLRRYLGTDAKGKAGLEAMLEQTLRGRRGVTSFGADGDVTDKTDPQPGADAKVTLDFALQAKIEKAFDTVNFSPFPRHTEQQKMNGAAVVIDVATGQVLAMASCPTFDPNTLDQNYNKLAANSVDSPMLNRATQVAREPGSTMKPVVGLSAMTEGLITPDTRIRCNGYLQLDGRQQSSGRCWTMSIFNDTHFHVPSVDPLTTDGLDFTDAIQRSCNVFFETLGDKFRIEGLRAWFDKFGLGRPTGVGLPESSGHLPSLDTPAARRRSVAWFAAIGQDQMAATPMQMANVAATIARNGIWERPTLVARESFGAGDVVDLHLSLDGLRMAHEGMKKVVGTVAGSAYNAGLNEFGFPVAGKTGSAQSAPLKLLRVTPLGKPQLDGRGRKVYDPVTLGTTRGANPLVPWYRAIGEAEDHVPSHAWMTGFAPADHPKIAFAVMVEYGGAGGTAAGSVVKKILEAAVEEGYLPDAKAADH